MKSLFFLTTLLLVTFSCVQSQNPSTKEKTNPTQKPEKDWKTCLTAEEYRVLRGKGTERAFTGKYYKHKEKGVYTCAGCGNKLFNSNTKFDSGTGWPSYWKPFAKGAVKIKADRSAGMQRKEVVCAKCDGHLGHVFHDGPRPTGLRYCINSTSLDFEKKETGKKE